MKAEEFMPASARAPVEVFLSYASEDDAHARELEKHLATLTREGLIQPWGRRRIGAGEDWRSRVDLNLEKAHLILLLISPDYLASDYCYDVEMERALERHRLGQARVIPVVLRPVDWRGSKFQGMGLGILPEGAKPVTHRDWGGPDRAWTLVAGALRNAITELQGAPAMSPDSMGRSYVKPKGGAVAPPGASSRTPAPPQNASRGGWVWTLAGLGAAALSALMIVVTGLPKPTLTPLPKPTSTSTPTPTPTPVPTPALACAAPCCGGSECMGGARDTWRSACDRLEDCTRCTSGRTCVPGACRDDLADVQWLLRLKRVDVPGVPRSAEVCIKPAAASPSEFVCTPVANAADTALQDPGERSRLLITTSDLLRADRGIDILIREGGTVFVDQPGARIAAVPLKRAALCIGVKLRVPPNGGVSFYLDDLPR